MPIAAARFGVTDVGHRRFSRILDDEGASLVFNGGFFDREFEPEGLVVSEGVVRSEHVESLSGGVFYVRDGRAALAMTEGFVLPDGVDFAVQCRPRLVVDGAINIASETGRRDARTALCIRDGGATLDVILAPAENDAGPTLLELATALHEGGCESALNLDGGPSTAGAWRAAGGPRSVEPFGPVRQAIAVRVGAP